MDPKQLELDALKNLQSHCNYVGQITTTNFEVLCKLAIIFIGYMVTHIINEKMKLRR